MSVCNVNRTFLANFAKVDFGNDNAIVQKSGAGMKSETVWDESNKIRWIRSSATKDQNNAIRAELLKNLGEAFGLEGPKTNAKGNLVFTKAFMDRLEQLLGPAFKRDDFGVGKKGGEVSSGRPLTERRIKAILNQVTVVTRTTKFNAEDYLVKADAMLADADRPENVKHAEVIRKTATKVKEAINFLQHDLETIVSDNPHNELYDPKNDGEDAVGAYKFVMLIPREKATDAQRAEWTGPHGSGQCLYDAGDKVGVHLTKNALAAYLNEKAGFLVHLETFKATPDQDEFMEQFQEYMRYVLEQYVTATIDLYQDSADDSFVREKALGIFAHPGLCMEAQTSNIQECQQLNGLVRNEDVLGVEKDNVASLYHNEKTSLLDCMAKEVQVLENTNRSGKDLTWDDYKSVFEKNLVGRQRLVDDGTGKLVLTKIEMKHIEALKERLRADLFFEG